MNQPITTQQFHDLMQEVTAAVEPWLRQRGMIVDPGSTPATTGPTSWTKVGEANGVDYRWPDSTSHFNPLRTYRDGHLELGLGFDTDNNGDPTVQILKDGVPFASFQPADDFGTTKELVGVIRGRAGTRKMFSITDPLPPQYANMTTARLIDRLAGHRFKNATCVVVKHDDDTTMLEHGKAQVELRGL